MVASLCGPGRWRSILVNPAPGVNRTLYLYQFIKKKFILSLSLRFTKFSSFSGFLLTLTPTWSFIPLLCLGFALSCYAVSPPIASAS
jgi:hypothetical protein